MTETLVVVGGGVAALTAAQTLRAEGWEDRLVLVSDEEQAPYSRVPLSKGFLAGSTEEGALDLTGTDPPFELLLGWRATGLDVAGQRVLGEQTTLEFDGLVIATGSSARTLGSSDQDEMTLRTLSNAHRLREHAERARSVIIVGGGVLGMEVASTLLALGLEVTVVDVLPHMERMLGPVAARHLRRRARDCGVRLIVAPAGVELVGSPTVTGVDWAGGGVRADLVVTAAGDIPNVEWLRGSGLPTSGGVITDEHCQVAPRIVAAGDVVVTRGGLRTPTWTSAVEQGRTAALSLLHGAAGPTRSPSRYQWTDQFGVDIKLVGEAGPLGQPQVVDGDLDGGRAVLVWRGSEGVRTAMSYAGGAPLGRLRRLLTATATA